MRKRNLLRPAKLRPALSKQLAGVFQNAEPPVRATQPFPAPTPAEADFSMRTAHAGLVLLHLFLPRFFESTGIKEEGNAELSPLVLPRAAALLHFLATGRETIFEYELPFIKILLGAEPETPLCVAEGLLTRADKEETEALLQAVIAHWKALKDTSIAGLRKSFLERAALLRKEENGWKLRVEREPFDVLLEHLPWAIGLVKLPWMKEPLFIEW